MPRRQFEITPVQRNLCDRHGFLTHLPDIPAEVGFSHVVSEFMQLLNTVRRNSSHVETIGGLVLGLKHRSSKIRCLDYKARGNNKRRGEGSHRLI